MIPNRPLTCLALAFSLAATVPAGAQPAARGTNDPIARIRDEGLNRSQVMKTVGHLTDVIGPRLTGSPQLKRANEWTREKLASWGLTNAHLEPWGPFGRGWSLQHFSAQLIEPQAMPLIALPRAWSPPLAHPLTADVVYVQAGSEAELEKHKGKLKGAIELAAPVRELKPRFEAMATRLNETNLLRLANAGDPGGRVTMPSDVQRAPATNAAPAPVNVVSTNRLPRSANAPRSTNAPPPSGRARFSRTPFFIKEGVAAVLEPSDRGDGGAVFVESAGTPSSGFPTNLTGRSAWSTNAPPFLPQIVLNAEHYNRLVRMAQGGEKLRMKLELDARYHTDDLMAYNTVAEIPGGDLRDELVMLGGHMDSWHGGTGATDNAAGVAVCMEAVRILQAVGLKPRRTIRIALWSGEEQGLLGSRAYVTKHFGYYTNLTAQQALEEKAQSPKDRERGEERLRASAERNRTTRKLVAGPEHGKISAYFNLDNGGGKVRGIYLQGNEPARPIFRGWLAPFADLGAETITANNTGGTDHQSFESAGVPGFQFIQDGMDYWTLTHHSNMDVLDRLVPEDMKQASVLMAAFVYQAAMADEKVPRKPERREDRPAFRPGLHQAAQILQ